MRLVFFPLTQAGLPLAESARRITEGGALEVSCTGPITQMKCYKTLLKEFFRKDFPRSPLLRRLQRPHYCPLMHLNDLLYPGGSKTKRSVSGTARTGTVMWPSSGYCL